MKIYIDGRVNNGRNDNSIGNATGRYAVPIDEILKNHMNYIYRENGTKTVFTTIDTLGLKCGLITENYKKAKSDRANFSNYMMNINNVKDKNSAYICFENIYSNVKYKIQDSIIRLNKNDNCTCEYGWVIVWDGILEGLKVAEMVQRLANVEERSVINKIEAETLIELGILSIKGHEKYISKYYSRINQVACERLEKCTTTFRGCKIKVFTPFNEKINRLLF